MADNLRTQNEPTKSYFLPILIIGALFFIFGFVTWLNGILIPYLQIACELTNFEALFVAFVFYIAYTIMALPSAWVLKKSGFKNGMMIGLFVMAVGTLIFVPAALSREFTFFLFGLFVMGTGLALLQTASNPYITVIGPKESAARRISILGICNKLAGAVAPLILAYYILNDGDAFIQSLKSMDAAAKAVALDGLAQRVINPYLVMTAVLVLLGIGIKISPLPSVEEETGEEKTANLEESKSSVLHYPHVILGVLALFFYVGAEVIAGDTIIRYGLSLGIVLDKAKAFTSYTMFFMILGYIMGIVFIPKYLSQHNALKISAILGIVFSVGVLITHGLTSIIFVALLGLANALVWPTIWPLALNNVGKHLNTVSALLIMAIAGGALLPLLWGRLSDSFGLQNAYLVLIPLYLFIWFYAIKGYRLKKWR